MAITKKGAFIGLAALLLNTATYAQNPSQTTPTTHVQEVHSLDSDVERVIQKLSVHGETSKDPSHKVIHIVLTPFIVSPDNSETVKLYSCPGYAIRKDVRDHEGEISYVLKKAGHKGLSVKGDE